MKALRRGARRSWVWLRPRLRGFGRWSRVSARRFGGWVRANAQEWAGFGLIVAGCWQVSEVLGLLVAGGGMLAGLFLEGWLRGRS